jgi:hypothetical protein
MTYACLSWEFAADSYLLKLQRLQNIVLPTTGNLPRRTPTRDLHVAFKISTRLDIEIIKGSSLVAVRHKIDQFSRLWIYPWAVYEQ